MNKKIGEYFYKADLKSYKFNPDTNNIDVIRVEKTKSFTKDQIHNYIKSKMYPALTLSIIIALFFSLISTAISHSFLSFIIVFFISVIICSSMCYLYYYALKYKDHTFYIGSQDNFCTDFCREDLNDIFADEISELEAERDVQLKIAEKWRRKHPLEEKIKLALTGNPNFIADLLRYCELVKPNKTTEKQRVKREEEQKKIEKAKSSIQVKYIE